MAFCRILKDPLSAELPSSSFKEVRICQCQFLMPQRNFFIIFLPSLLAFHFSPFFFCCCQFSRSVLFPSLEKRRKSRDTSKALLSPSFCQIPALQYISPLIEGGESRKGAGFLENCTLVLGSIRRRQFVFIPERVGRNSLSSAR